MPRFSSLGFEVGNALDRRAYPLPRRNRAGPEPSSLTAGQPAGAPPLPAPPITRTFAFALGALANTRSSITTDRLRGPAIVKAVHLSKTGAAGGSRGFGLGKSTSPVTENNVAIADPVPFTPLFKGLPVVGGAAGTPNDTTAIIDSQGSILSNGGDLNILITDLEFHLVIYNAAQGATAGQIVGYVTVLELVDPADLPFYMG